MKVKMFYKLKVKLGNHFTWHEEEAENIAEAVLHTFNGHGHKDDTYISEVKRIRRSICIVYWDEGQLKGFEAKTYNILTALKRFNKNYSNHHIARIEA